MFVAISLTLGGANAARAAEFVYHWGSLDSSTNIQITAAPQLLPIAGTQLTATAIAVVANDAFALNSNSFFAWGYQGNGSLGNGIATASSVPPVTVSLSQIATQGQAATAISTGSSNTLVLLSDGTVVTWGPDASSVSPAFAPGLSSAATADVTGIAATTGDDYVLKSDGTVWAWGSNPVGELGNGTTSQTPVTSPVQVTLPPGIKIRQIAAGTRCGFALNRRGTIIFAWGRNAGEDLGDGTTTDRPTPVMVKLTLPSGVTVKKVSAGTYFDLALLSNGEVWQWGSSVCLSNGQMGSAVPVQVGFALAPGVTVVGIAAGAGFGLARISNGTVMAWGSNMYGTLGNGQSGGGSSTSANQVNPVRVRGLSGVTAIAAGGSSALALSTRKFAQ